MESELGRPCDTYPPGAIQVFSPGQRAWRFFVSGGGFEVLWIWSEGQGGVSGSVVVHGLLLTV